MSDKTEIAIQVPVLPESITEATVVEWHVTPGETVESGAMVAEIETDKVVLEVLAPESGVVVAIEQPVGATVVAGEQLALLQPGGGTTAVSAPTTTTGHSSPAVRQMMARSGVGAEQVAGSGKKGRILKGDVSTALQQQQSPPPTPTVSTVTTESKEEVVAGDRQERRVPMSRLRRTIAQRLLEAKQSTAMLTTFNEVDMSAMIALRGRHKERFEKHHGVRLGFMSIFVLAATRALQQFPEVNASIDEEEVVYHGFCDIGIAVSSERGLVVPILRNTERMGLATIESEIVHYAQRAREGKLTLDELNGGTFTITNGGVFGSMLSTPILNPPQSAILGLHAIEKRPVVVEDQIVIRSMMYLALSYDHRMIDGQQAVTFLKTIKELVEDPARLLLEI